MAEIRLTPKGETEEHSYSLIESDGAYQLSDAQGICLTLKTDASQLELKEEDLSKFEEPKDIILERLLGAHTELLEQKASGIEATHEEATHESEAKHKPGYTPDDIFVENKPFSIRQLIDLIEDGDLAIAPNFQRNFVWDKTRQSLLIESILLGLPLPSIYLSQYRDGVLTVVDGLQRLHTIKSFMDNKLRLTNLEYLTECNGKTYKELDGVLSKLQLRRFSQTQIMCFVIDYRSPADLKFDLFRRLNTGGKPLNNQEIRNCLSRENVQEALREMTDCQEFREATSESIKDTRMEAQEVALRFLYFYDKYQPTDPVGDYDGNIDFQLNRFVEKLNGEDKKVKEIEAFKSAMKSAFYLFGRNAFRKASVAGSPRKPINKLLLVSFAVLLAQFKYEDVTATYPSASIIQDQFTDLLNSNETLQRAISWSTNSRWNIEQAFIILRDELLTKLFQTT